MHKVQNGGKNSLVTCYHAALVIMSWKLYLNNFKTPPVKLNLKYTYFPNLGITNEQPKTKPISISLSIDHTIRLTTSVTNNCWTELLVHLSKCF